MLRISAIKNSCGQNQFKPDQFNEHTLSNDLIGWRDVISNTLNVIQKMENSLIEWDKSLEKRQILDRNIQTHNKNNNNNINVLNYKNSHNTETNNPLKSDDL